MVEAIFYVIVVALLFTIYFCTRGAFRAFTVVPSREPSELDLERLADMRATRLSIVATLTECCDLNEKAILKEKHLEQVDDQFLSKFDASKEKRKQSSSSRATPVVKSLRGRKD